MKLMQQRIVAQAVSMALGLAAFATWACPAPQAKPFTAGPIMTPATDTDPATGKWPGPFSRWVVDSNGVGLQICTDSVDGQGNPPPCFYDPVVAGPDAYNAVLSRGGEAFWFLADSVIDTVDANGAPALRAVIVMGVESAFLSDPPAPGFETQFQRLRTRIDVARTGRYIVETPWGSSTYNVTTLLDPGNGQNRSEISEPIDITFNPGTNAGLVAPFLIADNRGGLDPAVYIGDGLTPTTVTGSPCGANHVQITAFDEAGLPIDIGGNVPGPDGLIQRHVYRHTQFTVFGKIAPAAPVPVTPTAAYYARAAGNTHLIVQAESTASATTQVFATPLGGAQVELAQDDQRFFARIPVNSASVPASVKLIAQDTGRPSVLNDTVPPVMVKDLVTISSAVANCNVATATTPRSCTITVAASSSDDGSAGNAPILTLGLTGQTLTAGVVTTPAQAAVPPTVVVTSSAGGSARKAITVVNTAAN